RRRGRRRCSLDRGGRSRSVWALRVVPAAVLRRPTGVASGLVPHLVCRGCAARCRVASMIRVGSIVFRVEDLQRQTEFWAAALDYVPREGPPHDDFILLRPRDGVGPNLSFDMHHSELEIPPRIHLDLYAEDQAAE